MLIKNIIFDVGNVLVKWSPDDIVKNAFPSEDLVTQAELKNLIFKSDLWKALNLGLLEESEAKQQFMDKLRINETDVSQLFKYIKTTQSLIPGMVELMLKLKKNGYFLSGLTDNINFVIAYLKQRYDFWSHLSHVTVSSEVGMMKPDKKIYEYTLEKNNFLAHETVFIDDHLPNVESARAVGMHAIQFFDTDACINSLSHLGVSCHG